MMSSGTGQTRIATGQTRFVMATVTSMSRIRDWTDGTCGRHSDINVAHRDRTDAICDDHSDINVMSSDWWPRYGLLI